MAGLQESPGQCLGEDLCWLHEHCSADILSKVLWKIYWFYSHVSAQQCLLSSWSVLIKCLSSTGLHSFQERGRKERSVLPQVCISFSCEPSQTSGAFIDLLEVFSSSSDIVALGPGSTSLQEMDQLLGAIYLKHRVLGSPPWNLLQEFMHLEY